MSQLKQESAAFTFLEYKIPRFSYNSLNRTSDDLSLLFNPSGEFNENTGVFTITLEFIAVDSHDEEKQIINVLSIAKFGFMDTMTLSQLPAYFYRNAIAIFFPYLRAFVSTLTLQANDRLLNLGLMNLSGLEKPLIENTKVIKN